MTRVALSHDYLTQRGGAERVALAMAHTFPGARLYTSLYQPETTFPEFGAVQIWTSPLNKLAFFRRNFRYALPWFGGAFGHAPLDPSAEVMLVSTTGFAHGIRTDVPKVVYCHSPARFIYLIDEYLGGPWWTRPTGWVLRALRPFLLRWDQRAAASADIYLCNSTSVQERIRQVYGREATVVPPPASLDSAGEQADLPALDGWDDHHLLVSRLMPYKNVDIAISAFRSMPDQRLLIIGRGPLRDHLARDLPRNVRMAGGLSDAQLRRAYATARAVIAPSFEDFGLTPVEGYSFGVPTLALRGGGYLDTVAEGSTGYFFERPEPDLLVDAVRRLKAQPLDPGPILEHAERYSPQRFAAEMRAAVAVAAGTRRDRS